MYIISAQDTAAAAEEAGSPDPVIGPITADSNTFDADDAGRGEGAGYQQLRKLAKRLDNCNSRHYIFFLIPFFQTPLLTPLRRMVTLGRFGGSRSGKRLRKLVEKRVRDAEKEEKE